MTKKIWHSTKVINGNEYTVNIVHRKLTDTEESILVGVIEAVPLLKHLVVRGHFKEFPKDTSDEHIINTLLDSLEKAMTENP